MIKNKLYTIAMFQITVDVGADTGRREYVIVEAGVSWEKSQELRRANKGSWVFQTKQAHSQ